MAFAVADRGKGVDARNAETRALMARVNAKQRMHLTGTMLNGLFAIRIAVVLFRIHQERMEMLLEDLRAALAASA